MNNMNISLERLLDGIGGIEEALLEEAETANISHVYHIRRTKRKRITKFGMAGLAVSLGVAVVYWKLRQKKAA